MGLKEDMDKAIKEKFWGALSEPYGVSAEKTEEILAECRKKAEIYSDIDNSMFIVTKVAFRNDGTEMWAENICSFELEPFILESLRDYYRGLIERLSEKE